MLSRIRAQLPSWRRALRRRRRLLVLLLCACLIALALPPLAAAVQPADRRGVAVVAAAVDVPAGTALAATDLTTVRVAATLVPAGAATDPDALLGTRTSTEIPAGSPILPAMLRAEAAAELPAGEVAMVITAPGVLAGQLGPGTPVELLAGMPESGVPRHIPAHVVQISSASGGELPLGEDAGLTSADEAEVVVRLAREDAGDLARAQREGWLTVSVVG